MLTLTLKRLLWVKGVLDEEVKEELIDMMCFPNPKYNAYTRRYEKKYIYKIAMQPSNSVLPRAAFVKLVDVLKKRNIAFNVVDQRITQSWTEEIISNIKTREYQEENIKLAIEKEQATIIVPAGGGKTEIALEIITRLRQNVIILVHTDALLKQWVRRIKETLNYDAGVIQGERFEVKSITIASVMTLIRREMSEEFCNYYGCVIVEEAHHCPSSTFDELVQKFPAKYRFGITADAKRKDGLEKYLFAVCGDPISIVNTQDLTRDGFIMLPTIIPVYSKFKVPEDMYRDWIYISGKISVNKKRNELIFKTIKKILEEKNLKILILSDRKKHLKHIFNHLPREMKEKAKIITADVNKNTIQEILELFRDNIINILLATQLADEGIDIPSLDCVILAFPSRSRTKIIQRVGRVQRMFLGKERAIVYDIVDIEVPTLKRQYNVRRAIYNELGYNVFLEKEEVV